MIPDALRAGPTWVIATDATTERWTEALRAQGMQQVVPLCWGAAHPVVDRAEVFAAVHRHAPDLVLLTSQSALTCLGSDPVPDWYAACVGTATLREATARGFLTKVTVTDPYSGGTRLAEAVLRLRAPPGRALWLRARDARPELAEALRARGVEVVELVTYVVNERPAFGRLVAEAPDPAAVLVGSPRGVVALVGALERSGRRLEASVHLLTLGETTAQALRESGLGSHPLSTLGPRDPGLASPE